jgi:hypothetical protein
MSRAKRILAEADNHPNVAVTWIDLSLLEGAGLSRINTHATSGAPYALVTASRHNNSEAENDRLNSELIRSLNAANLGGIQLIGYWQEAGDEKPTQERSFFVPASGGLPESEFRKLMANACSKYNQDVVLYSDGNQIGFLDKSGSFSPVFGRISFGDSLIKQGWSELRGKKFTMVEGAFISGNIAGRELWESLGLIPVVAFNKADINKALRLKK